MMMVVLSLTLLVAAASLVDAKSISLENEQTEPKTVFFLSDYSLYRMEIDTSVDAQPKMVLTSDSVMDYDFDAEQKKLFLLDRNGQIFVQLIDGKSSDKFVVFQSHMGSHGGAPEARMAYDFFTNKFYKIDLDSRRLDVIDPRNQIQETLIDEWTKIHTRFRSDSSEYISNEEPLNLVLDPLSGLMFISTRYYTEWRQIYRVNMDGTIKECIVSHAVGDALAVDTDKKRIYWPNHNKLVIESSDYNGDKRLSVVHFNHTNYILSLAVYNNQLYWTVFEYDFSRSSSGADKSRFLLKFCTLVNDKCEESTIHQVKLNLDANPRSLKVLRTSDAQVKFTNPCEPDNGSCQQLCLLTSQPGRKKCRCNNGWQLMEDEKSCRPIDKNLASDKLQQPSAIGRPKRQMPWDMYSQQPTLRPDPQLPQQPSHIPIYIFYPGK